MHLHTPAIAKGNRIEFILDQPDILLRGMADDAPGAVFSGRIVVILYEPIRVKGLKMVLEGHEHLDWDYYNDGVVSTFHRETVPITHRWTFFSTPEGKKFETWEAGRHEFPFSFVFPGHLPETISIPYAHVNYHLKATLKRSGIMPNIAAKREMLVKRDLTAEGNFGAGAIDVENRWREKLEFRISSNADTFTRGDELEARFVFQPLAKHMHLTKVGVMLKEYVRCHKPSGEAEKTVSRVVAHSDVVPDRDDGHLESGVYSLPISRQASGSSGEHRRLPGTPGVDLTHAVDEFVRLAIPTEPRRLQYDHISPYVEVTHKLKFSINFIDPQNAPHTLWVSVPVSVVPVINDGAHGPLADLPTYANAALDERVAVAAIEPNPPTYDTILTEATQSGATSPATRPVSQSSSSLSLHGPPEGLSTYPPAAQPQEEEEEAAAGSRVNLTQLTLDQNRPLVHPAAVQSFLQRRPVVYPASAEATPMATPHMSPLASPFIPPHNGMQRVPEEDDMFQSLSSRLHEASLASRQKGKQHK